MKSDICLDESFDKSWRVVREQGLYAFLDLVRECYLVFKHKREKQYHLHEVDHHLFLYSERLFLGYMFARS